MSAIPQLDYRLWVERSAIEQRLGEVKSRLRRDLRSLQPREIVHRYPEAAFAGAAVFALIAGRLAGDLMRRLFA